MCEFCSFLISHVLQLHKTRTKIVILCSNLQGYGKYTNVDNTLQNAAKMIS